MVGVQDTVTIMNEKIKINMLKKYLITPPDFHTDVPTVFKQVLREQLLKYHPEFILYRDKTNKNYVEQAKLFVDICSEFEDIKAFIHGDYQLAHTLGAVGVHLTSQQFNEIRKAKELDLDVVVSTHTIKEVLEVEALGADYVTYSPIFTTPNKGEPKGIAKLEELLNKTSIKVFALGGIVDEEQLKEIRKTKSYGFASIRYFQ